MCKDSLVDASGKPSKQAFIHIAFYLLSDRCSNSHTYMLVHHDSMIIHQRAPTHLSLTVCAVPARLCRTAKIIAAFQGHSYRVSDAPTHICIKLLFPNQYVSHARRRSQGSLFSHPDCAVAHSGVFPPLRDEGFSASAWSVMSHTEFGKKTVSQAS